MPNGNRHYRVTLGDVFEAHDSAIKLGGGRAGVQSLDLIESAIARPYAGYYRPIYKKAAALIQSIATNHGFTDANKRTAFIIFYLFIEKSGYAFRKTSTRQDEDDIEHLMTRCCQ